MNEQRFRSLDILRGAAVALMILVNNPGSWSHLYGPLAHAPWHGFTPTDFVFPLFLFAVGLSLAWVMPRLQAQGDAAFWRQVLRRTALIFAIGLVLNAAPFVRWNEAGELTMRDWSQLRTMGVLQRIALAFGLAAVVLRYGGARGALWAAAALLLAYWALCVALGGNGANGDPYSLQGWFGTAWDRALLGERHLYRGEGVPFDPEGLASTAPAVAQVLLGAWAGSQLVGRKLGAPDTVRLFTAAATLLLLAWAWQLAMPINKKIWTSSYVLLTTGLALALLAVCVDRVELRAPSRAVEPLLRVAEAFGRNALFVFVLSGLVPRFAALLRWRVTVDGSEAWTSPLPWAWNHLYAGLTPDLRLDSLLFALTQLALYAALVVWMDRRRLYVRV
jgi:predicted acyltransferase